MPPELSVSDGQLAIAPPMPEYLKFAYNFASSFLGCLVTFRKASELAYSASGMLKSWLIQALTPIGA